MRWGLGTGKFENVNGSGVLFRVLGRGTGAGGETPPPQQAGCRRHGCVGLDVGGRVGELDQESKSPPCREMRDKGGAPSGCFGQRLSWETNLICTQVPGLNLRLGTTEHLWFRQGLACSRRLAFSSSRNVRAPVGLSLDSSRSRSPVGASSIRDGSGCIWSFVVMGCFPAILPGANPWAQSKSHFEPTQPLFNLAAFESATDFSFYSGSGSRMTNLRGFGYKKWQ